MIHAHSAEREKEREGGGGGLVSILLREAGGVHPDRFGDCESGSQSGVRDVGTDDRACVTRRQKGRATESTKNGWRFVPAGWTGRRLTDRSRCMHHQRRVPNRHPRQRGVDELWECRAQYTIKYYDDCRGGGGMGPRNRR